ncbi:MAG: DUF5719 family protein [Acidimicrobiales bacterium]
MSASIALTNAGSRPVSGVLVPARTGAGGPPGPEVPFIVSARDQVTVPVPRADGAVTVLLAGGNVGVLEVLSGSSVWGTAPCESATSAQWYIADGSTSTSSTSQLTLFNPSSTDAVADLKFVTAGASSSASQGSEVVQPPAFQGISVPAGTAVVVPDGDHLPNQSSFATQITTLAGQLVAEQVTTIGTAGISVEPGVAAPAPVWTFPLDEQVAGSSAVFSLFNPGATTAHVQVDVELSQGRVAPLTLTVEPGSLYDWAANATTRVPTGVAYGVRFVASGSDIVAARAAAGGSSAAVPSASLTVGDVGGAERWLVPSVPVPGAGAWAFALVDEAPRPVRVAVVPVSAADGPVPPSAWTTVEPGILLVEMPPPVPLAGVPVFIEATGPVAIELDPQPIGAPNAVVMGAWPFEPVKG